MPQPPWSSHMKFDQDTAMLTHQELLRLICSEQRQLTRQVELLVKHCATCFRELAQDSERLGQREVQNPAGRDCGKIEFDCQPVFQNSCAKDGQIFVSETTAKDCQIRAPTYSDKENTFHMAPSETKQREKGCLERAATRASTLKVVDDISVELQQALKRAKKCKKGRFAARHKSTSSNDPVALSRSEIILRDIVTNPVFDGAAAVMILFNAFLVAASVECLTTQPDEESWMVVAAHSCNAFFFVELVLRMAHQGREFFICDDRLWNVFDFFLVVFSMVDFFQIPADVNAASSIKTLKMLRVVRIFRVFRFFTELSLMASMIASSLTSALWAGILICIIMFTFTIFFTQQTTSFLVGEADEDVRVKAHRFFGSVPRTFYSLIQTMLGGKSWGEFSDVLFKYNVVSIILFLGYVVFMLLAVLNVITGVFVDNAVVSAAKQRDFMIAQEMSVRQKYLMEMKNLFSQIDLDGSGTITLEEVTGFFKQEKWAAYFSALGIDVTDIEQLFFLLDDDGSGALEIDEFVDGCLRLKGNANRTDCAVIIHTLARVEALLKRQSHILLRDRKEDRKERATRATQVSASRLERKLGRPTGLEMVPF